MPETSPSPAPAPFPRRLRAFVVDGGLAAIPAGAAALLVRDRIDGALLRDAVAVAVLGAGVPIFLAVLGVAFGTTPGKRVSRLRVIGPDGGPAGRVRVLRRELAGRLCTEHLLLAAGGAGAAGYLWALRDRDHQTWHDRIAGTRVVAADAAAPAVTSLAPRFAPHSPLGPGGLSYASFWERVGAFLLDVSLVVTVDLTAVGAIGVATGAIDVSGGTAAPTWFGILLAASVPLVGGLYAAAAIALRETTVGKHAVGLVVRREDGGRVGFGRALLRELVGRCLVEGVCGLVVLGLVTLAGHLASTLDERRQTWHDKIGGTVVLRAVPGSAARRVDNAPGEPAHSARDVRPAPGPLL